MLNKHPSSSATNLLTVLYFLLQRRADLKGAGQGGHVDLPVAWTELAQLAQCKGKIQEGRQQGGGTKPIFPVV